MIIQITKENLPELVDGLVNVSQICWPEIKSVPWGPENFYEDSHWRKFDLSFCYVENGVVVGLLIASIPQPTIGPQSKHDKYIVYIHKLAVLPEFRKCGIAKKLLVQLIKSTRLIDSKEIRCSVDVSNLSGKIFLGKCGFYFIQTRINHEKKLMWLVGREV